MLLATWNLNSIKMRLPLLLAWLEQHQPDVMALQELKCESDHFPLLELQGLGYHALVQGQKSYNGVALLARHPLQPRLTCLPGDASDSQARYVEAEINGWIVASLYLPNGNPVATEKFPYKLAWMQRLYHHALALLQQTKPVVLAGDFNVILENRDAATPENWQGDALFHPQSRAALRQIVHTGYVDAFRSLHPNQAAYSFWDYQASAWPRDDGIRIDHLLLSPPARDRLTTCTIDRAWRGQDKASDHTPVLATFT